MIHPRLIALVCSALVISACVRHNHQAAPVSETRTLQGIAATFDHSQPKIYKVYADRLKVKPDLKGRVVFRFTITANGSVVQNGIVESTLNDREVEDVINSIIAKLDFGKVRSPGNLTISYPMDFFPQ